LVLRLLDIPDIVEMRPALTSPPFPYTTLFRSCRAREGSRARAQLPSCGAGFSWLGGREGVGGLTMASPRTHEHRQAATHAGLRYVTDGFAGIRRRRSGTGWIYFAPDGARIKDQDTRKRLNKLAIPPAW